MVKWISIFCSNNEAIDLSNSYFKFESLKIKRKILNYIRFTDGSPKKDILLVAKHKVSKMYFMCYYSNSVHIVRDGVVRMAPMSE